MTRKTMSRQVTKTIVKVAKIEVVDGVPTAVELPTQTLVGNVKMERAQRLLDKEFGYSVTITELKAETETYEMYVDDFIKYATVKVDKQEEIEETE